MSEADSTAAFAGALPIPEKRELAYPLRVPQAVRAELTKTPDAGRPTRGNIYKPEAIRRQRMARLAGLEPAKLASIIRDLERGDTERWSELTSFMLRTDSHLRGVWESRLMALAAAEPVVEEADASPAAKQTAELCRQAFDKLESKQPLIMHLASARGVGPTMVEHDWRVVQGAWHSVSPVNLLHRDVRWADDFGLLYRTWLRSPGAGEWLSLDDEAVTHPRQFIWLTPYAVGMPAHLAPDLLPVAWQWLWKRWASVWRNEAIERHAAPFTVGYIDDNAPETSLAEMNNGLEHLTSNGWATIRKSANGTGEVQLIQPSGDVDGQFRSAIESFNAEISKGILGSTLNTEIGHAGGNRAAAESQAATSITPRIQADATAVAEALRSCWLSHVVHFNAHHIIGRPVMPKVELMLEPRLKDGGEVLTRTAVESGIITANELREKAGFEPKAEFDGQMASLQSAAPRFSDESRDSVPLARTPSQATRSASKSMTPSPSPTSTGYQQRIEAALAAASDSHEGS